MSNCFLFSMKLKFIYIYPARACGGWYTMAGYGIEWKTSDTHAKKWHKTCFKDVAKYLLTVPSTMYMNECAWTKRSTILALFYVQSGLLDISLLSCTLRAKYMAISSPKCVSHFLVLTIVFFNFFSRKYSMLLIHQNSVLLTTQMHKTSTKVDQSYGVGQHCWLR